MRAYSLVGPHRLEMVETPAADPESIGPGQVLLRVLAGGICGSDLPHFSGARARALGALAPTSYPIGFPLHEVVGEIVSSRDPDLPVGAIVVGWASNLAGLAELVIADGEGLYEYDLQLPPTVAVMLQPLACVISAVNRLGDIRGAKAAVIGQGSIGLLFSHVLKTRGVAEVTGVDPVERGHVAQIFGVDNVVQDQSEGWAASLTQEADRPNLIIEAVGHQRETLINAIDALSFGGHLFYFGIPDEPIYPFPMMTFLRKNGRMTSGSTSDRKVSLVQASEYLREHSHLIDSYITDTFSVADAQSAFETALSPSASRIKVILDATEW